MQQKMSTLSKSSYPVSSNRVLIIVENCSVPFDRRVWMEAIALSKNGYQVCVISPWDRKYNNKMFERKNNIYIYRYFSVEAKFNLLAYMLEYLSAILQIFLLSLIVLVKHGIDFIQICNPPDILFLVILPFKVFGKKIIFDQHDLVPELYLERSGQPSSNIVYRILILLERFTYIVSDIIISPNESYRQIALQRGRIDKHRVTVVRYSPDLTLYQKESPNTAMKAKDKYLLFYAGTMGPSDGMDYLLRALKYLQSIRSDFYVLLVGDGSEAMRLKAITQEMQLDYVVSFVGRKLYTEVIRLLKDADVCLSPDPKSSFSDLSTMTKVLDYMAASKPIVAFDLKETRVIARNAALYARNNNERDFAKKISKLLDSPELRKKMGCTGYLRIIQSLSCEHSSTQLLNIYNSIR